MKETAEALIAFCRENNRICPMPQRWDMFWKLLPTLDGEYGRPPPPLILAAWHDTAAIFKMIRLAEQIECTAKHDALEPVAALLRGLREDEWFHVGD